MTLRRLSTLAPVMGVALMVGLIWALCTRLDLWEAKRFVGLLYGALGCTVGAHLTAWMSRRRGEPPPPRAARELRSVLTLAIVLSALWVFFPSLMRGPVGWSIRQVSTFRFH